MQIVSGAVMAWVSRALKALKHIEAASESCITKRQRLIESGKDDVLQGLF